MVLGQPALVPPTFHKGFQQFRAAAYHPARAGAELPFQFCAYAAIGERRAAVLQAAPGWNRSLSGSQDRVSQSLAFPVLFANKLKHLPG